jgi:glutathione S-transferase
MDWQASDLNSAWRHVFMARVRQHPDYPDDARAEASLAQWNRLMGVLDAQLAAGGYVAGTPSPSPTSCWGCRPSAGAARPATSPRCHTSRRWFERLRQQPGFAEHVDNGVA